MEEDNIKNGEKIIKFPDGVMTVTIPKDVFVEVNELGSECDYPSTPGDFELIGLIINIAFFVCEDNGRKYVDNLDPPAKIRIWYDDYILRKANGRELKLAWWNKKEWVLFDKQEAGQGYVDVETSGWPKDPPVGWGC